MSIDKKKIKKFIGILAVALGAVFVGMRIVAKKKKADSVYENEPGKKNPMAGKKVVFVEDENGQENADGVKGHLEAVGDSDYHPGFYDKYVKRIADIILSFGGLVALSPVFLAITIVIKIDDPGSVLFTQKRIGQNKEYFKLHKFRTMKMSTPHDVPTHMLDNPEQYITRVGKFLRKHSLDELPQIWDIFIGNMSVIGPRPGLWNQDMLTAERDRYGANDVKPGLTGLAQINGRDELEIPDKAKLDGEYVKKIGLAMDIKCFLGSLHVFGKDDSVVEGGTGERHKANPENTTKKVLFVANVGKEHILKFHIPTIIELKNRGWQVDVACAGQDDIAECDTQYIAKWTRSPFTVKTFLGIKQLRDILDNEKYDVIYCHTPVGGIVGRLGATSARKKKTKVIYCAHGLHFYKGAPLVNWLIYYPVEKVLSLFTDEIITINDEDYNLVKERFPKRITTKLVPGVGVDFDRLNIKDVDRVRAEYRTKLGIPQSATVLVYVAELIDNKNQSMLIDALREVHKSNDDVYLVLAGPEHDDGMYKEYAKQCGLSDNVLFLGWRSDIGELLHMSDICVASSIREGFGINIIEAMYCGLPVIATNNRGHISIIRHGENGLLVNVNDYKAMAHFIQLLIDDEGYRQKLSNIDVGEYDCKVIAQRFADILEEYTP